MDQDTLRERLYGCYVTIPTMFNDDDEMSVKPRRDSTARRVPD